jgi:hypothetical protein
VPFTSTPAVPAPPGRRRDANLRGPLLVLSAAAALALLPFVLLGAYAFPSADDYCLATQAKGRFWEMQWEHYVGWTGRYAASLLQALANQWDLSRTYAPVAHATIGATFLAFLVLAAAPGDQRRGALIATAAVATAVFVGGLPSTVEAFYWMPSSLTYQWGLIAFVGWLALLVRLARPVATSRRRIALRTLAVLLTMLLPGFNEVTMPIVFATLGALIVLGRRDGSTPDRFLLVLLAIAAVAAAVALLAPGNAARSHTYPPGDTRHNLEFALAETARQTVRFVANHASYAAPWVAAFAAWWWGRRTVAGVLAAVGGLRRAGLVLAGLLFVIYLTLFPLYWEYGETNYTGEGRTYNATYFVLCAAIVWGVGILLSALPPRWTDVLSAWRASRAANLLVAGALAAAMIAAPSTLRTYGALAAAPAYLEAQRAREMTLRAAAARGEPALVPVVDVRPYGLYWGDLDADAQHWINVCAASYYGVPSIRASGEGP